MAVAAPEILSEHWGDRLPEKVYCRLELGDGSRCDFEHAGMSGECREAVRVHRAAAHGFTEASEAAARRSVKEKARASGRKPRWTRQAVLEALRAFRDEHGRDPKTSELNAANGLPSYPTVMSQVGGVKRIPAALAAAGMADPQDPVIPVDLMGSGFAGAAAGEKDAAADSDQEAAGVAPDDLVGVGAPVRKSGSRPRWTNAELLHLIRDYAAEHGYPPGHEEWRYSVPGVRPGVQTWSRRFGSWNAAVEAAGLVPRSRGESISRASRAESLIERAESLLGRLEAMLVRLENVDLTEYARGTQRLGGGSRMKFETTDPPDGGGGDGGGEGGDGGAEPE